LGLSKDRPSIVPIEESDSQRQCCPAFPQGRRASFEMRTPIPICVPPAWFFTTSTVYSSSTTRPYCRPLPILGFTAFPPVAKQDFPLCTCCPSKLSLRRQRRHPERILVTVGSRHRLDRLRPLRSPRTLPSRPFSLALILPQFPAAFFSVRAGASRPCSIVGSVAHAIVSVRLRPVLPWACPTRPPERPPDAPRRKRR